jgi:hypothetical protein
MTPNQQQTAGPTIRDPNFDLEKNGRDSITAATPWTKRLLQDAQFNYKTLLVTKQPFPEAEHLKTKFAKESWDLSHKALVGDEEIKIRCNERIENLVSFLYSFHVFVYLQVL